ncbi:hypothetical protein LX32DRAFT_142266 [Colletotrichum zoysiae]|uniref:Uncharacterized protein n=1 Tax=Colletotrichum zoysiae TaxID=1216348 RepID=A0AAD9H778_9PEZI|nr:hypothetical protein LX32DRAFT_142266 [Colletotrichum zoysiae]
MNYGGGDDDEDEGDEEANNGDKKLDVISWIFSFFFLPLEVWLESLEHVLCGVGRRPRKLGQSDVWRVVWLTRRSSHPCTSFRNAGWGREEGLGSSMIGGRHRITDHKRVANTPGVHCGLAIRAAHWENEETAEEARERSAYLPRRRQNRAAGGRAC